jgi:hypothetical protein
MMRKLASVGRQAAGTTLLQHHFHLYLIKQKVQQWQVRNSDCIRRERICVVVGREGNQWIRWKHRFLEWMLPLVFRDRSSSQVNINCKSSQATHLASFVPPLLTCRQGSSSFKSPEEGYFQEGNSYSHEGSLLPPQDSFVGPKAQVPKEVHP